MPSQINASNSGFGGIVSTGDSSGVLQLQTTGTTALTIDTSQKVLIGTTTSPSGGSLQLVLSNSLGAGIQLNNSTGANGGAITSTGGNGLVFFGYTGAMGSESYTERMRIDSSGNVGIGNTGNTNWRLLVSNGGLYSLSTGANGYFCVRGNNQTLPNSDNGTADTPNLAIGVNYTNGSAEVDYFNCNNGGDGHWWYQKTGASTATNIMRISSGGNLTISGATATKASGTTWANPSDIRLKDNVQDFNKGLNELLQVNVKTWEYNGKGGTVEGTKGIGVIADEIETILPETVDTYKAKLNETDTEETDIKRFDATEITWLLVKAIQEQQVIINDLKARVTALEAK